VLEQTPSTSEIAVVTFADKVHDVFDFSKGRPFLRHWAAQEPTMQSHVKGETALLDAVMVATQILQPSRAGDTIYAITDGGDNVSHASPGDVKKVLMRSGVRLYVFLFAEYVPRGAIWFSPAEFMEIARDSGGYIYGVPSRGEAPGTRYAPIQRFTYDLDQKGSEAIKAITQSLCAQIGGFYSLQIIDPELKKDGKLKMEVKANSGEPMKDVNSAYPSVLSRN